jgi:hypothetical protein
MTPLEFRVAALVLCAKIGEGARIHAAVYTQDYMGEKIYGSLEYRGVNVQSTETTFEGTLAALESEWATTAPKAREEAIAKARAALAALEAA